MRYTIGQLAEIIDGDRGKNYPKQDEFYPQGYCLFLNTGNVTKEGLIFEENQFITKEKDEALRKGKLKGGDIVYTTRGTVGNAGYYNSNVPYENVRINSGMVILRANGKIVDARFLYQILKSEYYRPYFKQYCTGSAQPQLPIKNFSQIYLNVPDIKTQHRIADILSAYDDLIENNQKQIKLLEEAAQRLYKEWFVDLHFPGHENTKVVDGVPEGWRKFPLEEIAPVVTGKKDANYGDKGGNYPFFTCSQETITAPGYSFDTSAVILAGNGDFNVKLYRGKFEAYQRTYVLAPFDHSNLFNLYFTVQDNMEALAKGASGSTIKFLTKGMLQKILVLTADKKVLDKFNDYEENIQQKVEALKKQVEDLTEIRNRLLPKLMSGEVEV